MADPIQRQMTFNRIQLVKGSKEPLHSDRLLLVVRDLEILQNVVEKLYQLESGNAPALQLGCFDLPGKGTGKPWYLLHIRCMYSYQLITEWLQHPRTYQLFYQYAVPVNGQKREKTGQQHEEQVFIRWGRVPALPQLLEATIRAEYSHNLLVLLGISGMEEAYLVIRDAQFGPLVNYFQPVLNARVLEVTAPAKTNGAETRLRKIAITLQPAPPEEDEPSPWRIAALQEQIMALEFQKSILRSRQKYQYCELRAYEEFEDHSDPRDRLKSLQDFILSVPVSLQAKYHYQRVEFQLGDEKQIYHLLCAANETMPGASEQILPPLPSRRFYLHPDWQNERFYLPYDHLRGRWMEFYPPLQRGDEIEKSHHDRIVKWLLGQPAQPDERVLFWPVPWPEGTIYRLNLKNWQTLDSVWESVNLSDIRSVTPFILGPSVHQLVEQSVKAAGSELSRIEARLRSEWAGKFDALEKAYQELQARYETLERRKTNSAEGIGKLESKQTRIEDVFNTLKKLIDEDWDSFVNTVNECSASIMPENPPAPTPQLPPNATIRARLARELHDEARRLENLSQSIINPPAPRQKP